MDPADSHEGRSSYSPSQKRSAAVAIAILLFGGGWASLSPRGGSGNPAGGSGRDISLLTRRLEPKSVASETTENIAAAAEALVRAARRAGIDPREVLQAALPAPRLILGMLALDRDIDDFLDYAGREDAVGAYYRDEARLSREMRPLRRPYEAAFAAAYAALSGAVAAPIPDSEKQKRPYIAAPEEVWLPPESELPLSHPFALDVFFQSVATSGEAEKGPAIHALYPGIVVAAAKDWSGGQGVAKWRGGGLSPSAGNGLVLYDPASRLYCSYFHLSSVVLRTGDLAAAGAIVGRGGNSGMNARKKGHGEHVHIEIFDAERDTPLSSYEILDLLKKQ